MIKEILNESLSVFKINNILIVERFGSLFANETLYLTQEEAIKLRDYLIKTLKEP